MYERGRAALGTRVLVSDRRTYATTRQQQVARGGVGGGAGEARSSAPTHSIMCSCPQNAAFMSAVRPLFASIPCATDEAPARVAIERQCSREPCMACSRNSAAELGADRAAPGAAPAPVGWHCAGQPSARSFRQIC
jgi:hypothetical protein